MPSTLARPKRSALAPLYVPRLFCVSSSLNNVQDADLNRTHKTAEMPEQTGKNELHSGQGTTGTSSGKGGHEPKTVGENKGLGAHKADGPGVGR